MSITHTSVYYPFLVWSLAGAAICYLFQSRLIGTLLQPSYVKPPSSLEELLDLDYQFGVDNASSVYGLIQAGSINNRFFYQLH